MGATLNKLDVNFDEMRIYRELQPDATYKWYGTVGYIVTTTQGETINRDYQFQLTTGQSNTASNFFTTIKNQIKGVEGI